MSSSDKAVNVDLDFRFFFLVTDFFLDFFFGALRRASASAPTLAVAAVVEDPPVDQGLYSTVGLC